MEVLLWNSVLKAFASSFILTCGWNMSSCCSQPAHSVSVSPVENGPVPNDVSRFQGKRTKRDSNAWAPPVVLVVITVAVIHRALLSTHMLIVNILWNKYYCCPHFTDGETRDSLPRVIARKWQSRISNTGWLISSQFSNHPSDHQYSSWCWD